MTVCVLQWLRSHDAMLASLSGRKMRPFKPVVSAAPPPTANYYYLSFRLAPSLTASAAVQFAASARQSAAREGSTHRKPLMTCPRGSHETEWVRTWRRIVEKKDCGMSGIAYQIQSTWPMTGVSWQMADDARVRKPSSP